MKTTAILIHGLTGNGQSTWGSLSSLLTSDQRFRSTTLEPYTYPSPKLPAPWKRVPTIAEVADGVFSTIEALHKDSKIILFGHSMGGIVARQLLIDCAISKNPNRKAVLASIQGVIFIATPHLGSQLASSVPFVARIHAQVRQLIANNEVLTRINRQWAEQEIDSIFPCYYIHGDQDQVVPFHSAHPTPAHPRNVTITGKNHTGIIRPKDHQDGAYRIIASKLHEIVLAKSGNPFFDIYAPEHESFYINRAIDKTLSAYGCHNSIWISGPSGVGKTNALKRLCELSSHTFRIVNLSTCGNSLKESLGQILYSGFGVPSTRTSTEEEIKSQILSSIKSQTEKLFIMIEEISFSNQQILTDLCKEINDLIQESVLAEGKIQWLLSSIPPPPDEAIGKYTRTIRFGTWESSDCRRLIETICTACQIQLSAAQIDSIIESTDSNPREIKRTLWEEKTGAA